MEPAVPLPERARFRGRRLWRSPNRVFTGFINIIRALLTAALYSLEHQDFGFEQNGRMVAKIDPRLAGYPRDQLTPLYQRIHDSLAAMPGVSAVAVSFYSPLSGNNWGGDVWIDGRPAPGPSRIVQSVDGSASRRISLDVVGN